MTFRNFIEEFCTGTGATITLTGQTSGSSQFSDIYTNTQTFSYVIEDANGVNIVGGVGTYNSAGDTITRNDSWAIDGTGYDATPIGNLTLTGGTHIIRVAPISDDMNNWDTAFSWGDHSLGGYITGVAWGSITGTLSSQTDLQSALNAKYDATNFIAGTDYQSPLTNVAFTNVDNDFQAIQTFARNIVVHNDGTAASTIDIRGNATNDNAYVDFLNDTGVRQGYMGFVAGANTIYGLTAWNFSGAAPTILGNAVWTAGDFTSTDVSNWNTAYGWGDHANTYLPLTGGTLSGALTVNSTIIANGMEVTSAAGALFYYLDTAASDVSGGMLIQRGGTSRWFVGKNGDAESTGEAGSNFSIVSYSDAGVNQGATFSISRATGDVSIYNGLAVTGNVTGANLNVANWDTAFGWGDHSGVYFPLAGSGSQAIAVQELHITNQEPTNLTADGQLGYDASIGLMLYKTQNYGDAGDVDGVYMVLDTGNIATDGSLQLTGNGVTAGGTTPLTIGATFGTTAGTVAEGNHTHLIADITDFTDNSTNWNNAYNWVNPQSEADLNTAFASGPFAWSSTATNSPGGATYGMGLNIASTGLAYNEVNNWLFQLACTTGEALYFREVTNADAHGTWKEIYHSGNFASGVDYQPAGSYLLDTTDTFTGTLTVNGDINISATSKLFLDGGVNTYIQEDTADNLRFVVGNVESLNINSTGLQIQDNDKISGSSATNNFYKPIDTTDSNRASLASISHMSFLADTNNNGTGAFYWMTGSPSHATADQIMTLNNAGTLTLTGDLIVNGGQVVTSATSTRDKLRVWNSSTYTIGMMTGFTYGGLGNDYAMTFQMNSQATRGFWWGDVAHTNAQGAMALTTDGELTVAKAARIGYGESDTTSPGATYALDISGTGYFSNGVTVAGAGFAGPGGSISGLNGSNITTGTVAAARVATLNQSTTGNAATATALTTGNKTITGVLTVTGATASAYFESDGTGVQVRLNESGWTTNLHDVIYNGYTTATSDYVYLKASGNSTTGHGRLIVGDNGLWYGTTSAEIGGIVNSSTIPNEVSNRFKVDSNGYMYASRWYVNSASGATSEYIANPFTDVLSFYTNLTQRGNFDNAGFDVQGAITATGNITAYSSDERLKDAKPLHNAMNMVNQWRAIRYTWNDHAKILNECFDHDRVELGLSAQSVEKTAPELVSPAPFNLDMQDNLISDENYLTIDYGRATSVLVAALQEKDAEIQEMKAELAEIKEMLNGITS